MSDHFDVCIVGAGVIGLAIAQELSKRNRSVIILDKGDTYGSEISSRNSEVIHAGIYYPKDSLKATLCVQGKEKLYAFCEKYRVSFKRQEKLIVATSDAQSDDLHVLQQRAADNGVNDLEWISQSTLSQIEPNLKASLALRSPSTGIINSHDS